jgi:hypothetical protein
LLAIANLFLFKPSGSIVLEVTRLFFPIESLPHWYRPLFWTVEAGLVLAALAIAVRTMPRATPQTVNIPNYKAIKGLRPFTQEDAEVFAQLQRQGMVRQCLESVSSVGFRFSILHGVSGCGKTSFLQAGMMPQLSTADASYRGIYVRLGGQDPVQAIASAFSTTLEIPADWVQPEPTPAGFRQLLQMALNAAEKPLILFLDQFEQYI